MAASKGQGHKFWFRWSPETDQTLKKAQRIKQSPEQEEYRFESWPPISWRLKRNAKVSAVVVESKVTLESNLVPKHAIIIETALPLLDQHWIELNLSIVAVGHHNCGARNSTTDRSFSRMSSIQRPHGEVRLPEPRLPRPVPLHRRPVPVRRVLRLPRKRRRESRPMPFLQDRKFPILPYAHLSLKLSIEVTQTSWLQCPRSPTTQ